MVIYFATLAIVALWWTGSARRLRLVRTRIKSDWAAALHLFHERGRLLFQGGSEALLAISERVITALCEVEKQGGPLKSRLKPMKEAERELQQAIAAWEGERTEELESVVNRLDFALETYNDGVRLLRRLKGALFHWPMALFMCPRRVDLVEAKLPTQSGAIKLAFKE